MHHRARSEAGELSSPRSSRAASFSSDRPSVAGAVTFQMPSSVRPPPAYIAASVASQIVTDHHNAQLRDGPDADNDTGAYVANALFSDQALCLLNAFLDHLLFAFLSTARSPSLTAIRPAITEVLKPRLARDAMANADEELQGLLAGEDDEEFPAQEGKEGERWDVEKVWKRTRLRIMVYTRLGELEDEDEDRYVQQERGLSMDDSDDEEAGLVSWASAIFLTSVIEYVAEQTLLISGQASYTRLSARMKKLAEQQSTYAEDQQLERIVVEDFDVEKVALNSALGRLWRTWRKRVRSPIIPLSPRGVRYISSITSLHRRHLSHDTADESIMSDGVPEVPEVPEHKPTETEIAANIPLPISDNDVNEIEVPGLARTFEETESSGTQTPVTRPKRPSSVIMLAPAENFRRRIAKERPVSLPPPDAQALVVPPQPEEEEVDDVPFETPMERMSDDDSYIHDERQEGIHGEDEEDFEDADMVAFAASTGMGFGMGPMGPVSPVSPVKSSGFETEEEGADTPTQTGYDGKTQVLKSKRMSIEKTGPPGIVRTFSTRSSSLKSPHHTPAGTPGLTPSPESRSYLNDPISDDELDAPEAIGVAHTSNIPIPTPSPPGEPSSSERSGGHAKHPSHGGYVEVLPRQTAPTSIQVRNSPTPEARPPVIESPVPRKEVRRKEAPQKEVAAASSAPRPPRDTTPPKTRGTALASLQEAETWNAQPKQSVQQSQSKQPVQQVQQKQPVQQVQQKQPVQQAQQKQQVQQVQQRQPVQQVQQKQPVQSAQSKQPVQPVQSQPKQPIQQVQSKQPVQQAQPKQPLQTAQPVIPDKSARRGSPTTGSPKPSGSPKPASSLRNRDAPVAVAERAVKPKPTEGSPRSRSGTAEGTPEKKSGIQRVSSSSSTGRSVSTSILHSARDSDASLNGRPRGLSGRMSEEDRVREFDSLVKGEETVKYTLTPQNMRDIDESPVLKSPVVKRVEPAPQPTSNVTVYPRVVADKDNQFGSQHLPTRTASRSKGPVPSSGKKAAIAKPLAREAQIKSESMRDFADFIRSTGPAPGEEKAPQPFVALNGAGSPKPTNGSTSSIGGLARKASTRLSSSHSQLVSGGAEGPSAKPRIHMEPRSPAGPRSGNDDLIDFIRQGPPGANNGQPRIPRAVAPFRTTVDSDQFEGMLNDNSNVESAYGSQVSTNSKQSTQTSNSRTGLLPKQNVVQPAYSNTPQKLSGSLSSSEPHIQRTRRRVKDPYAIDSDDEDEDLLTALPKSSKPPQQQQRDESMMDFLNSMEPPSNHAPQPFMLSADTIAAAKARAAKNGTASSSPTNSIPSPNSAPRNGMSPRTGKPPSAQPAIISNSISGNASAPRVNKPKLQARAAATGDARAGRSTTNDLADFLRTSGPPEPVGAPAPGGTIRREDGNGNGGKRGSGAKFWRKKTYGDMP